MDSDDATATRHCVGFLSRTPGPPAFSSMNSIPAEERALKILEAVSARPPRTSSEASRRLMVGIETPAVAARSSCDQPSRARAAFICLIDTFSIDILTSGIDTFSINSPFLNHLAKDYSDARTCQQNSRPPHIYRGVRRQDHYGRG
jgi:hypothetical protein